MTKTGSKGIRLTSPRPYSKFVILIDTEGHLRLHGALIDRSLLPGQRKLISVIDVLVIAEMGEFSDLNLNPDEYKTVTPPKDSGQSEIRCLSDHTHNHSFSATRASSDLLQ